MHRNPDGFGLSRAVVEGEHNDLLLRLQGLDHGNEALYTMNGLVVDPQDDVAHLKTCLS